MSVAEIQAAIDALATPEQEQIHSRLTARLADKSKQETVSHDPVLDIIGIINDPGGPTDIARNYKEYLYGHGGVD